MRKLNNPLGQFSLSKRLSLKSEDSLTADVNAFLVSDGGFAGNRDLRIKECLKGVWYLVSADCDPTLTDLYHLL